MNSEFKIEVKNDEKRGIVLVFPKLSEEKIYYVYNGEEYQDINVAELLYGCEVILNEMRLVRIPMNRNRYVEFTYAGRVLNFDAGEDNADKFIEWLKNPKPDSVFS